MREQRSLFENRLHAIRIELTEFLGRPDEKNKAPPRSLLINEGVDDQMRFDSATKAELHLRAEELRATLWQQTEGETAAHRKLKKVRPTAGSSSARRGAAQPRGARAVRARPHARGAELLFDAAAAATGVAPVGAPGARSAREVLHREADRHRGR